MGEKLQITVLCGGVSAEHEISVLSARNVVVALDPARYEVSVIYISQLGEWYRLNEPLTFLNCDPAQIIRDGEGERVTAMLGDTQYPWMQVNAPYHRYPADCIFPVLHGTLGEDGTIQGLLDVLNVPYVGSGVLGSSICMEKHVAKKLLRAARLPTPDWVHLRKAEWVPGLYENVEAKLGSTLFIKPAGLGSSIGITKVDNAEEFDHAVSYAFQYDDQIIIEPAIVGREIEVSVLGNEKLVASLPGEIISRHEFYSYEAKYLDPEGALVITPAELSEPLVKQFQELAVQAFKELHCSGMARVDFFLKDNGEILINELNTIPGFTDISMYPKNWEVSGMNYRDLLDALMQLALSHYQNQQQLTRVRTASSSRSRGDRVRANEIE